MINFDKKSNGSLVVGVSGSFFLLPVTDVLDEVDDSLGRSLTGVVGSDDSFLRLLDDSFDGF